MPNIFQSPLVFCTSHSALSICSFRFLFPTRFAVFQASEFIMEKHQIRVIFLYEFKLGRNATETAKKINQVFGPDVVNDQTIRRWFDKFRTGNTSLVDEPRLGRPGTVDDDVLRDLVEADPLITIRELAAELSVSHTIILKHLKAMGKAKKLDKWIPHELTPYNQTRRFEICSALDLRNKNDPFLDRIITCDEKWILYDNRKRSARWLDSNEAPKRFPKPKTHQKKIMVTMWWPSEGVIHYSLLKPGESITADSYCKEIDEMHEKIRKIRPALVNRKGPILLHDNARPHVSQITVRKLNDLGYETLPHPPYSPDLSPTDYQFFKHLDHFLTEKIFTNQTAVENALKEFIESRDGNFYWIGINKLVSRWQKCIDADGLYFG